MRSGIILKRIDKLRTVRSRRRVRNEVRHGRLAKPIPQIVKEPYHFWELALQRLLHQRRTRRSFLQRLSQHVQRLIPNRLNDLSFLDVQQLKETISHQVALLAQDLLQLHHLAAGGEGDVQDSLHVTPESGAKARDIER